MKKSLFILFFICVIFIQWCLNTENECFLEEKSSSSGGHRPLIMLLALGTIARHSASTHKIDLICFLPKISTAKKFYESFLSLSPYIVVHTLPDDGLNTRY